MNIIEDNLPRDLIPIVNAWRDLPEAVKNEILAMVKEVDGEGGNALGLEEQRVAGVILELGAIFLDGFPVRGRGRVAKERFELGAEAIVPLFGVFGGFAPKEHGERGTLKGGADVAVDETRG